MSFTVLAYGEVLWDLLPTGAVLGGAPFNFLYRVRTLGDRGLMVSRLGRDELGREALGVIRDLGMDTRHLQWDQERPTGRVEVSFDAARNPQFNIIPGVAYDHIEPTEAALEAAAGADCVCFGTLIQRGARSRDTLGRLLEAFRGRLAILDINLRPECYSDQTIRLSIERADVLKLNDGEAAVLGPLYGLGGKSLPAIARGLLERTSLQIVVVTLGERGALAASRDGQMVYHPGYAVELVDSLGSGDAFTAGFVHALLRGRPLGNACRYGNALGAMVARQEGATRPLDPAEVEPFMARARPGRVEETLREFLLPDSG
ncbi:MAG: carbohydrate kinase [Spirochaetales bacterium]|nr:carbohydrate kinase [Spirochaetales bacterium]